MRSLLVAGTLLLTACAADPEDRAVTASVAGSAAKVEVFGSVREVHEGDTDGVVRLDRWKGVGDLYAVGALEGLRGEVTIVGGVPVASLTEGGGVQTRSGLEVEREEACLLVAARV